MLPAGSRKFRKWQGFEFPEAFGGIKIVEDGRKRVKMVKNVEGCLKWFKKIDKN